MKEELILLSEIVRKQDRVYADECLQLANVGDSKKILSKIYEIEEILSGQQETRK